MMTPLYRVTGTVPADSPLSRLAGRTITLPAHDPAGARRRAGELRQAGAVPVVWQIPPVPWSWITWGLTSGVIASALAGVAAILAEDTEAAWTAAGSMILLGLALFPALTHLEMEAGA
ncbi:hypothetical protein AB0B27_13890 [Micromonospora rifamycinica]|uniref:hypothetical protein n=1 Tax=Micromonospora rifamycinica TaxID=291594 RepID=UPI0033D208B1